MNLRHATGDMMDAGLLIRHLHGELNADEARAVAGHLTSCESCRSFAESLAARARNVREALRAADFDEPAAGQWRDVRDALRARPSARLRSPRLPVAALWVLIAVATAGMASASVRTWVVEQWARLSGESHPGADAERQQSGRAALSFRPIGDELHVTFETTQAGGMVVLRFTDDQAATVSVAGGGAEQLAVGERGLHVGNEAGSLASFRVTLPLGVERVHVRIGGTGPIDLTRSALREDTVAIALDSGVVVRNTPPRDDQ